MSDTFRAGMALLNVDGTMYLQSIFEKRLVCNHCRLALLFCV